MTGYNNALVAVDLAGDVDTVLQRATEFLHADATLSILHVMEPANFYFGLEPGIASLPPEFELDMLGRAKDLLAEVASRHGIAPARQHLEPGHAPTQILRLAQDKGVDLIIVGSHGRNGWRLLLGSTASAVLHGARCDVLAVRIAKPK